MIIYFIQSDLICFNLFFPKPCTLSFSYLGVGKKSGVGVGGEKCGWVQMKRERFANLTFRRMQKGVILCLFLAFACPYISD